MPSKSEKERRKRILDELGKNARVEFLNSLPMPKELFHQLFDYLDEQLAEGCDRSMKMTLAFLRAHEVKNMETVLEWLNDKGGYCDCEVLMNVEEMFE